MVSLLGETCSPRQLESTLGKQLCVADEIHRLTSCSVSGDCNLPDETYVVEHGSVSISTFIVDYSAPENFYAKGIRKRLEPLTKKDHGH